MSYVDRRSRAVQCVAPGCLAHARCKGLCVKHYNAKHKSTSDGKCTGPTPKLTADDCALVRKMSSQFKTQREIAAHFNVKIDLIRKVLKGTYKPREVAS